MSNQSPDRDSHSLLPEQEHVLTAIVSNPKQGFLIECPAGGAKTFLLVQLTKRLPVAPTLAIAFNKRNAVDLQQRMPSHIACKTFNALGHAAWQKRLGSGIRLILEPKKVNDIATELCKELKLPRDEAWTPIRDFIAEAKSFMMLPPKNLDPNFFRGAVWGSPLDFDILCDSLDLPEPSETIKVAVAEGLRRNIISARKGKIDFDDQLYMSLCFGGIFPQFPTILVDEVQDLSPANIEMVSRSLKPGGRVIAVGDRYQGIYAFRGASAAAVEETTERFSLKSLSADTTFRCPPAIATLARSRHPRITPFKTEGGAIATWETWSADSLPPACTILCRNNAPLMSLALKLFKAGRGANFIGGDLSKQLAAVLSKIGPDELPSEAAIAPLEAWKQAEISAAEAKGKSPDRIADKAECIHHLLLHTPTIREAKAKLFALFQPNAFPVLLSTIHKSKGFEWPIVIFLDPERIPSPQAQKLAARGHYAPLEQELNLRYVCQTRASDTLIHASMSNFQE